MAYIETWLKENPDFVKYSHTKEGRVKIADYVWSKSYEGTDAPRMDFEKAFLGAPLKSEGIFEAEYEDQPQTRVGKAVVRGVGELATGAYDMFKGDAAEDIDRNVNSAGYGNNLSVARASMFGNDERYLEELKQQFPELKSDTDENGNVFLIEPNGERFWLNKPGADLEDVTRILGKVLPYAIGGAQLTGVGAAWGAWARGAAGLTHGVGVDALQQGLSGGDYDPVQGGIAGITGGVSEGLAIPLARQADSLKGWWKAKYSKPAEQLKVGRDLIKATDSKARGFTNEQIRELGRSYMRHGDSVNPEATMDTMEHGHTYLRSKQMNMPDLPENASYKDVDRAKKKLMRGQRGFHADEANVGESTKATNVPITNAQNQAVNNIQMDNFIESLGDIKAVDAQGNKIPKQTFFKRLQDAIYSKEAADKAEFEKLYRPAEKMKIPFDADDLQAGFTPRNVSNYKGTRQFKGYVAQRMLQALDDAPGRINNPKVAKRTFMALDDMEARWDKATTFDELIDLRREFDQYSNGAKGVDRRGLTIMRQEWNKIIDGAIQSKMRKLANQPGRAAYRAASMAREGDAKYHAYLRNYKDDEFAEGLAMKVIKARDGEAADASSERVANYLIGIDATKKVNASEVVRDMKRILGPDPKNIGIIRQAVFRSLTMDDKGAGLTGQALVDNLDRLLSGNAQSLGKSLYSKKQLDWLRRYRTSAKRVLTNPDLSETQALGADKRIGYALPNFMQKPFMGIRDLWDDMHAVRAPSPVVFPASPSPYTIPAAQEAYNQGE